MTVSTVCTSKKAAPFLCSLEVPRWRGMARAKNFLRWLIKVVALGKASKALRADSKIFESTVWPLTFNSSSMNSVVSDAQVRSIPRTLSSSVSDMNWSMCP